MVYSECLTKLCTINYIAASVRPDLLILIHLHSKGGIDSLLSYYLLVIFNASSMEVHVSTRKYFMNSFMNACDIFLSMYFINIHLHQKIRIWIIRKYPYPINYSCIYTVPVISFQKMTNLYQFIKYLFYLLLYIQLILAYGPAISPDTFQVIE